MKSTQGLEATHSTGSDSVDPDRHDTVLSTDTIPSVPERKLLVHDIVNSDPHVCALMISTNICGTVVQCTSHTWT